MYCICRVAVVAEVGVLGPVERDQPRAEAACAK